MSYNWEKFYGAITALTVSGTEHEQLASAYKSNLIRLSPAKLPDEIQKDFLQLKKKSLKLKRRIMKTQYKQVLTICLIQK